MLGVAPFDRAARAARGDLGGPIRRLGWCPVLERLLVAAVIPSVFYVVPAVLIAFGGARIGWWVWATIGVGVVLGIVGVRAPTWSLRSAARRNRVCWSCGYDLRGVPAGEDGCLVCPECNAAWRVPSPDA